MRLNNTIAINESRQPFIDIYFGKESMSEANMGLL